MRRSNTIIVVTILLSLSILSGMAHAYWVWTPETKKFINPKYAVKDTPKEQYDWAMGFYNAKDYQRSAAEFEKLVKSYEYSEYASDSQYRVGLSYDNMGKYYIAFQNYQKAVDNFPHVTNIDEIVAREYNIAGVYASKSSPKVLGTEIMTSFDRAIEIYKKVVDNAPFGKFADEAQFKMAMSMKDAGRYDEATIAFQKILDDYPTSKLYEQARYEMANSAYRASLQPAYDASPTDKALKAFEDFSNTNTDEKLNKEAQNTIRRLRNKAAEKSFITAQFYEQQKHYVSAIIYYQDVVDRYPDTPLGETSKIRIEDLKIGNYSHRSAADFMAQKKGWLPAWTGENKKLENKIFVKGATPAPTQAPPIVASEKQVQVQKQVPEMAKPAEEAPKVKSKKSWWSFGLGENKPKAKDKSVAPVAEKKPHKPWTPFGFGSKKTEAKNAAIDKAKPAEAPKVKSKKSWWSFGLGENKPKAKDKSATPVVEKKPNKPWTPFNFDKKTEGAKKDE